MMREMSKRDECFVKFYCIIQRPQYSHSRLNTDSVPAANSWGDAGHLIFKFAYFVTVSF